MVVVLGGLGDGDLESASLRLLEAAMAEMLTLELELESVFLATRSLFVFSVVGCWKNGGSSDLGVEELAGRCRVLVDGVELLVPGWFCRETRKERGDIMLSNSPLGINNKPSGAGGRTLESHYLKDGGCAV